MKNKKGFTLVELLAVIVILALIMGIAVISMSGVIASSRSKTYQETAASIIHGVRNRLMVDNEPQKSAAYAVSSKVLESGGTKSSYNEEFKWATSCGTAEYCATTVPSPACAVGTAAYVSIDANGKYSICLADGKHYVNATEADLLETKASVLP